MQLLTEKIFRACLKNSLLIFVLISAPVTLIMVSNFWYLSHTLTKITYNTFEQIALNSSSVLDERLDGLAKLGINFTANPQFRKYVSEGKWVEAALAADSSKYLLDENFIDLVFLADPQGTVKSAVPEAPDIIDKNFSYRDWYKGVVASGEPYVSEVYRRANAPEENIVAVATPIVGDSQQLTGILVFQVPLDHFLGWVNKTMAGTGSFIYIVDQKGQIVASPAYSPQGQIINYGGIYEVEKVLAGNTGINTVYNPNSKTKILVAYHPSRYHWGVLVEEDANKAFAERNSFQLMLAGMFILSLFINGIFVILLKKAIVSPSSKYK